MKALETWDSWTGIKELSYLCKAGWNGWTFQVSMVNVFESYDQSRNWGFDKRRKSKSTTYRFREWRHSTDVLLSRSKTLRVGLHGNLAERPEFYNYDLLQHGGACRSAVKTCVRPKLKAWVWRCQPSCGQSPHWNIMKDPPKFACCTPCPNLWRAIVTPRTRLASVCRPSDIHQACLRSPRNGSCIWWAGMDRLSILRLCTTPRGT